MKLIFGKHKKIEICALLLASLVAWWLTAPVRGGLSARVDVARGNYRLLTFGRAPAWTREYSRLLRDRYGVELKSVGGCTVSQELVGYVEGYDKVSSAAAKRKYGHDIFEESYKEALRNWQAGAAAKTTHD